MTATTTTPEVGELVMRSKAMRELDRVLRVVAPKQVVVSLVGESGTGKELLARRIHELSPRSEGPFVPINCAAIPEALFESELFGHEKGAFTGATDRAFGKIEAAGGGTLFLDEIGEMPLSVQAKLLRFLENRKFMRVGGNRKVSVDARLICATLRPLEDEVREGRFRADLFYRIQGIPIHVPPLRARPADIGELVRTLTAQIAKTHRTKRPKYGHSAMAALRAYPWPGNVRELRNVVELLCLLREGKAVRVRDLPAAIQASAPSSKPSSSLSSRSSKEEKTSKKTQAAPAAPPTQARAESPLPDSAAGRSDDTIEVRLNRPLTEIVDEVLQAALDLEGGNRSRAARRLGVSLRTMQRFATERATRH